MRVLSLFAVLALSFLSSPDSGHAAETMRLVDAINRFRSEVRACDGAASVPLPPLRLDSRLVLRADGAGDLQGALAGTGYPMATVRAIGLSGPREAQAAMSALDESYCRVLLDPQFVDICVSQQGRDWRIVLARPLLAGRLGDWQAEGRALLERINTLRAEPRQCGDQAFAAAPPVSWQAVLGESAEAHARAMANGRFFSHLGAEGYTPGDRAELAGFDGAVNELLAAGVGVPQEVVDGWLATPALCAVVMSPRFSQFGGAYASDPQSDAGIYWVGLFGTP
ncbi:CAP domain-containing protein [Stutzerimonas urumqiensis]|uniref:CAP domain-containing protein n=1 Tax=Stutzerimonas urumqiensis TaxID=638269 RepID=UPI003BAC5D02